MTTRTADRARRADGLRSVIVSCRSRMNHHSSRKNHRPRPSLQASRPRYSRARRTFGHPPAANPDTQRGCRPRGRRGHNVQYQLVQILDWSAPPPMHSRRLDAYLRLSTTGNRWVMRGPRAVLGASRPRGRPSPRDRRRTPLIEGRLLASRARSAAIATSSVPCGAPRAVRPSIHGRHRPGHHHDRDPDEGRLIRFATRMAATRAISLPDQAHRREQEQQPEHVERWRTDQGEDPIQALARLAGTTKTARMGRTDRATATGWPTKIESGAPMHSHDGSPTDRPARANRTRYAGRPTAA